MSQLIESIKIYNGRVYNIQRHNTRCNNARFDFFQINSPIDLRRKIQVPDAMKSGLVKCRIIYNHDVNSVEFEPYSIKQIRKVAIIEDPYIRYTYKTVDRTDLDNLRSKAQNFDEIIITQNGLLTDAYYYNIVLQLDGQLYTPSNCLLKGVMRQKLLDQGRIKESQMNVLNLKQAQNIYFINALTPLGAIRLDPKNAILFKK